MTTIFIFFSILLLVVSGHEPNPNEDSQAFIVEVQNSLKPSHYSDVVEWYSSTLRALNSSSSMSSSKNDKKEDDFLHIYDTVFHGFSARLTRAQAMELGQRTEIVSVYPDRLRELHTTRSPEFLGLGDSASTDDLLSKTDEGSNVIIGIIDTGIWPERRSFDDEGLGPIPSRWRGECDGGVDFPRSACNKKLIGVRYFFSGQEASARRRNETFQASARDTMGHGTHTASTAAGRRVGNASFFGYAPGVSSGIAPKARLAMYKVCFSECHESDILAGIDAAVRDGVDVISVSLGAYPQRYNHDIIAVAAFRASARHGVVFSASAGNSGPYSGSVCNDAPWIITVGAGTIDRSFPVDLVLGDSSVVTGTSLYPGKPLKTTQFPLTYAKYCLNGSVDPNQVKGKIVVCDAGESSNDDKVLVVWKAGGVGTVVANMAWQGENLMAKVYTHPGLSITESARVKVMSYLASSNTTARAKIVFRGTHLGAKPAPVASYFTSRGPSDISPDVLKPDVIAPGVNILAAWTGGEESTGSEFNIVSGTSMSCPHVAGIAALLKRAHPEWTPAMVRSAMMTTAYKVDRDNQPIEDEAFRTAATPWDIGAGHVDPVKAVDPGLVYDLTAEDYIKFLCASNYTDRQIKAITGMKGVGCRGRFVGSNTWDLNYPAIVVRYNVSKPLMKEITVTRRVTHVNYGEATYSVEILGPKGVGVRVDPLELVFRNKGETHSYTVTISVNGKVPRGQIDGGSQFGQLTWTDGKRLVTSPLVLTWVR